MPSRQGFRQDCKWYARNMSYPFDIDTVDLLGPSAGERSGEFVFEDFANSLDCYLRSSLRIGNSPQN